MTVCLFAGQQCMGSGYYAQLFMFGLDHDKVFCLLNIIIFSFYVTPYDCETQCTQYAMSIL